MMEMDAQHYKAVMTGKRSKAAGAYWESMISAACQYYRYEHKAEIEKTPEPMRPIRALGQGKFIAHYEKMAQPDYKGSLHGGKAIIFEAKHTDSGRMQRSVISSEQEKQLDRYDEMGATCFVLLSFGFERFFRVNWCVFRDMKKIYGRKYLTPDDIPEFEIHTKNGVLRFLG